MTTTNLMKITQMIDKVKGWNGKSKDEVEVEITEVMEFILQKIYVSESRLAVKEAEIVLRGLQ